MLDESFVVPGVAACVHEPRQGAFDDPTPWQDDESGGVFGPADGLDGEPEVGLLPGDELSGGGGCGSDDGDLGCMRRRRKRTSLAASRSVMSAGVTMPSSGRPQVSTTMCRFLPLI